MNRLKLLKNIEIAILIAMILAVCSLMNDLLEDMSDVPWHNKHPNKQDEIVNILQNREDQENKWEYMKNHNIGVLQRLAKYYYGTDEVVDYTEDTEKEVEVGNAAYLYTLITYEGEDLLVHIGNGEFNTEVFTRKNISKLMWFSHSPLKLFVVSASVNDQVKESEPKTFLNTYALIHCPRWWEAELRISHKQREKPINFGNGAGILNYQDTLLALKNAEIHKLFPLDRSLEKDKSFEKFVEKIQILQKLTREELQERCNEKEGYRGENEHNKEFNNKLFTFLWRLSDGNLKNMYKLIGSFDIHKKVFVASWHKKHL